MKRVFIADRGEIGLRAFRPSPGTVRRWRPPGGRGVGLDSHVCETCPSPPCCDSISAKPVVTGAGRDETLARAASALARFDVEGVAATLPFHSRLIASHDVREGRAHTRRVEQEMFA